MLHGDNPNLILKNPTKQPATIRKEFVCEKCDKDFVREQDLKSHKTRLHKRKQEEIRQSCSFCDFTLNGECSVRELKKHEHEHLKQYCELCKQTFQQKDILEKHRDTCHKTKPGDRNVNVTDRTCYICEFKFSNMSEEDWNIAKKQHATNDCKYIITKH